MKAIFTIQYLKIRLITALIAGLFFSTSYAMDLSEAKSAGLLGEQVNGYLGIVKKPASEEVISLVKSINTKRKAKYQEIALSKGIDLKAVEKQAGIRTIQKTQTGYFINKGQGWQKK